MALALPFPSLLRALAFFVFLSALLSCSRFLLATDAGTNTDRPIKGNLEIKMFNNSIFYDIIT